MPRTPGSTNFKSTKVKTTKLCVDCRKPITKKSELCTPCEEARSGMKSERTKKDEEYRKAYLKHKQL